MADNKKILADLKLTPRRFAHTLGVAKTALELAHRHYPEYSDTDVEAAALMHDYTKELSATAQLELCEKFGISLTPLERANPKLLHAKTASVYAKEKYGLSDDIVKAVYWHTTGKPNMSGLEAIIYLSDYIEPGRTDESCKKLREYYYKKIESESPETALIKTLIKSFDTTINYLIGERRTINPDTVEARNYYVELLEKDKK